MSWRPQTNEGQAFGSAVFAAVVFAIIAWFSSRNWGITVFTFVLMGFVGYAGMLSELRKIHCRDSTIRDDFSDGFISGLRRRKILVAVILQMAAVGVAWVAGSAVVRTTATSVFLLASVWIIIRMRK